VDQHRPTHDRHGAASPGDPALADYWATRRKARPPIDKTSLWLLKAQNGRCAICGTVLLPDDDRPQNPREWEQWLASARKALAKVIDPQAPKPDEREPRLIHARCRDSTSPALLPVYEPTGLASYGGRVVKG
jgi:RNA-directed DNA polymerase